MTTLTLTPEEIAELERLEQAATKPPWRWGTGDSVALCEDGIVVENGRGVFVNSGRGSGDPSDEDRDLIIALRNAAPQLIAAAKKSAELEALLARCEEATANCAKYAHPFTRSSWGELNEAIRNSLTKPGCDHE